MFSGVDCLSLPKNADFVSSSCASRRILRISKTSFLPMRSSFRRSLVLCTILFTAALAAPPAPARSRETVAMSVGRLLEEGHYPRAKLHAWVSKKFLQTYLEMLDFSHLFFTQEDVDSITEKYANSMAPDVLMGTLKPAYEIYALYTKRVDERVAKIKELLKQPMDFKSNATVEL